MPSLRDALGCPDLSRKEAATERPRLPRAHRGREIRRELRLGAGDRDLLHQQPLDHLGDHRRCAELALRRLLRALPLSRRGYGQSQGGRSRDRPPATKRSLPALSGCFGATPSVRVPGASPEDTRGCFDCRRPTACRDAVRTAEGLWSAFMRQGHRPSVQMQRQFRTNNETFVVDNHGADAIGFDALFAMFSTKISNFATAKMVLGPGKRWNPDQEQSRWLYFALGFLLENRMQLMEIDIKDAARTLLDVVCTGRIRHRAVDIRNERNFGREVLRIIGYRRSYLVKRLNVPGNPQELREFFEREQQPLPLAFDEDLFRVELPRDLIELMKRHDPGKFQTVRLSQDPLEAAKAVNRFARNFFRPYIAAIENLPVTVSAPLSQRVYSLDTVQFDDDLRASLLINRAQELPVLAKAHFSSTRDRAVLEEIVRDLLTRPEVRELVDRHLRVTPRAGHTSKRIGLQSYFQRFDEHSERQAVASAQWQRIGSVSH